MSYSLNSLKGGYIGDYIGDYYRAITGGYIWGFPKIRGTILGVPIIRTIVFWGSILGSPHFEKLPYMFVSIYLFMVPPLDPAGPCFQRKYHGVQQHMFNDLFIG